MHSSISRYALEAGSARLARKIDTYINTSKMAELPKMLERRDTGEPMHVHVHVHICQRSISSRGDYSRAASISFRACSGAATIRERRLFKRGVYSVIYGRLILGVHKFLCPLNNSPYGITNLHSEGLKNSLSIIVVTGG